MTDKHTPVYDDYIHAPNNTKLDNIPGDWGLPVVGHSIPYFKDPVAWAKRAYEKHGSVVKINAFGIKGVAPLGPDMMQRVYLDPGKDFSSKSGYGRLEKIFGTTLIAEDFATHKHQRRIMQTAFKADSLKAYTQEVNAIYDDVLAEWEANTGKTISGFDSIKRVLLLVAAKVFFGETDRGDQLEKLNRAFIDAVAATFYIMPYPIPGTVLAKGLKGRKFLDNYFRPQLAQRRAGGGHDMLSCFCREKDEEGRYYPDDEIISQMIFLMFAAHDTTTVVLTNTLYFLAHHPEVKEKLYQEALSVGKESLDFEDLGKMEYMQQVFNEVLRMRPSLTALPRRTIREVEMGGYTLPANTYIMLINGFSHFMEEYWSKPYQFDPDRFSAERAEHKKHPFQFHPFGGGAHKCIGMNFSQMEYKCFLYKFILKYDFVARHKTSDHKIHWMPMPVLKDGMPIELRRR